jgi:hypothetical protein
MIDEEKIRCCICIDDIKDNKYNLNCGHSYHTQCIMEWFNSGSDTCPICRKSINNNNYDIDYENIRHERRRRREAERIRIIEREERERERDRQGRCYTCRNYVINLYPTLIENSTKANCFNCFQQYLVDIGELD